MPVWYMLPAVRSWTGVTMLFQELDHHGVAGARAPREAKPRSGLYILLVLAAIVGAFVYHMREAGIFTCPATAYGEDRYLGYCQGTAYGDYDHGALWFGLEPGVREAAAAADVLFLGNSRMQFGFSAPALGRWFEGSGLSYYLLGFSHNETSKFTQPLLAGLQPTGAGLRDQRRQVLLRAGIAAGGGGDARGRHAPPLRGEARLAGAPPGDMRLAAGALRQRDLLLPAARHRRVALRRVREHRPRGHRGRPAGRHQEQSGAPGDRDRQCQELRRRSRGGSRLA